ncbi:MAG: Mu transposase C-terminal domain-containing protein [Rhodocyclaceae bacterium]|nr:Mu transposase C-terminal domain-containing protein [Rhodocyclaceae bacterium]
MNTPALREVQHYTLAEIAEALGCSKQFVALRAKNDAWPFNEVPCRGGKKRLYPAATLPKPIADALQLARLHQHMAALPVPAITSEPSPGATSPSLVAPLFPVASASATGLSLRTTAGDATAPALTSRQLDVERARERLLDFIAAFPGSIARAIDHLNAERYAGRLPLPLVWAFDNAWDKPRANLRLTVKTYHNWRQAKARRGRAAPKRIQPDMEIKPWYGLLLALRQRPQGSCYTWIHEQLVKRWDRAWGDDTPSYDAVRRVCVEKLSVIDQLKGRWTGSALRQHKHWKPRTSDGMVPWQEVHADGWNTHFTAPHPQTGEFVTYEVWHFHDVATRFVPPPGIGLTETYEVITAGLERCVRAGGMMAILQTDSTKVVKRSPRFTADPFAALSERAGITVVHPVEVGNSQANGICENFNTWLDKQARELATYQGKGMDSLSLKRIKKLTEKMVKAATAGDLVERDRLHREAERAGKGRVFRSYAEAEAWINAVCDHWNDEPHRELPKIADPLTGRRRHQTPREAMQAHIDAGWQPVALSDDHLVDLFRPHVRCKVTREAVAPIGNKQRYRFPGLGAWNGQEVLVAIDPMDWRAVWVKTLEGELLGVADLVEASGYRAKSQYELAEEKRASAQIKRKTDDIAKIRARSGLQIAAPVASQIVIGGRVIDAAALSSITTPIDAALPQATPAAPGDTHISAREVVQADTSPTPRSRREMSNDELLAAWQAIDARIAAGEAVSDDDAYWHGSFQRHPIWRAWARTQGQETGNTKRWAAA